MECISSIKVRAYQFEWTLLDKNFVNEESDLKSELFYAGVDRQSIWCMGLLKTSEKEVKNFQLILHDGYNLNVSCQIYLLQERRIVCRSNISRKMSSSGDILCVAKFINYPNGWDIKSRNQTLLCILHIEEDPGTIPYVKKLDDFKELLGDIHDLLFDKTHTDVSIISKDGQKFRAHKAILSVRSEFFSEIFDANFSLSSSDSEDDDFYYQNSRVELRDIEGRDVEQLLEFIYSANFSHWSWEICVNLLAISGKHSIWGMKETCADYLINNIKIENAVKIFKEAHYAFNGRLEKAALEFIAENMAEVSNTPDWEYMPLFCEDLQSVPTSQTILPSSTRTALSASKKRKGRPDSTEHLMTLATEYFKRPETEEDVIAKGWAIKLKKLHPDQRRFAEKNHN